MSDVMRRPRRPGRFHRVMMAFLGLFDRWLHLSCRSFIRTASEGFERRLTGGERARQAVHRAMCSLCRVQERHLEQLRVLAHEAGHHAPDEGAAELSPESVARIRRAMEAGRRDGE